MPCSAASTAGQPNPDQLVAYRSPESNCATTACNGISNNDSTHYQQSVAVAAGGNNSASSCLLSSSSSLSSFSSLSLSSPSLQQSQTSSYNLNKDMPALPLDDRRPVAAQSIGLTPSSFQQAERSSFYAGFSNGPSSSSSVPVDSSGSARSLGGQENKQQPSLPLTLSSSSSSASLPSPSPLSPHQLAPLRFAGESDLSLSHELGSFLSNGSTAAVSRVAAVPFPLSENPSIVSRVPQVLPSQGEPCAIVVAATASAQTVSPSPSGHIPTQADAANQEGRTTSAAAVLSSPAALNSAATASQASVDFAATSKGPILPSFSSSSLSSSSFSSSFPSSTTTTTNPSHPTNSNTMSLPSPPTLPSDSIIDSQQSQPIVEISIDTTTISDDEQHIKTIAQQYHQLMTPSISHTPNTVSGDNTPHSRVSLSDGVPSPSRMSTSSQSSFSSNDGGYQLHDGPHPSSHHQQQHSGDPQRPLNIMPLTLENLKPVPQKSEDWAALIDTPASPIERYHPGMMMMPPLPPPVIGGPPSFGPSGPRPSSPSSPSQFQAGPQPRGIAMTMPSGAVYTDSPGPESSADYMQHVSQQQQYQQQQYYHMNHAQTDPGPRQQQQQYQQQQQQHIPYPHQQGRFPYQHHQQHNSTPSFQGVSDVTDASQFDSSTAAAGPAAHAANRKSYRKSWSASETLDAYGTLTPPRMNLDQYRGSTASSSRGSLNSKPSSAAMSVSLLTDAAILAKYRDTAIKTNDAAIQLSFAKYLLEIGDSTSTYEAVVEENNNNNNADPAAALPPRPSSVGSSNSPPSSAPSSPATGPQDTKTGKKQLILEGVYWIDRLAKEGHPEAQFIRGTWYEEGMYLSKKNADKALRWYQSSSKGDYGPAHYKVAYFCEKKKDNNKAVMLYKKAAIHNDVPANHRLAMVYLYGDLGQSQNMKAGLQYLKRAASFATEAAPMAPYVLGLILSRDYSNQLKIPDDISFPDDGEALEWFRKSAQLGYGPANYKLGYCYEYGSLGCPIDPFLSIQHYERAVMGSDGNGEAEMALSGWYLSGADNCFAADDRLAFHYASLAAEKNLPKAQYAMGYYHEVGISVPIDLEKAMEFYKRAAENGNKDAKKRLEEQAAKFTPLGHKNSIKRMKNGRKGGPKDGSCTIM